MYGMKLFIQSKTSMVQLLKFSNGLVISNSDQEIFMVISLDTVFI